MKWLDGGIIALLLFLTACSRGGNYAPVGEISLPLKHSHTHTVIKGETLYAVAWRYDMDYRTLAAMNQLSPPYALTIGQVINLKYKTRSRKKLPVQKSHIKKKVIEKKPRVRVKVRQEKKTSFKLKRVDRWLWPAKGRLVKRFSPQRGHKGIDISGRRGTKIRATAAGIVAYSGQGLQSYGKLIIIKHNQNYLSAYAHNNKILVKEGQWIKANQIIAEMGNSGTKKVKLHFEIRKAGKPVNPLRYVKSH